MDIWVGNGCSRSLVVTTDLKFSNSLFGLNLGNLLVIGSSLFWAVDNNISKIITKRVDILKIAQLKSGIGGGILLVVFLSTNIPFLLDASQIPFVLLLGIVGFAASLYFFLRALRTIGILKTIVIFATSSAFGLIFAITFLHEKISEFQILAMGIMILGVYLINKKGEIDTGIAPP